MLKLSTEFVSSFTGRIYSESSFSFLSLEFATTRSAASTRRVIHTTFPTKSSHCRVRSRVKTLSPGVSCQHKQRQNVNPIRPFCPNCVRSYGVKLGLTCQLHMRTMLDASTSCRPTASRQNFKAPFTQDAEHLATGVSKLWDTLWSMGMFTQVATSKGFHTNLHANLLIYASHQSAQNFLQS